MTLRPKEQIKQLRDLAKAIGQPTIDYSTLKYSFMEGSVIFTSEGQLVGMIHRVVYDLIINLKIEGDIGD